MRRHPPNPREYASPLDFREALERYANEDDDRRERDQEREDERREEGA